MIKYYLICFLIMPLEVNCSSGRWEKIDALSDTNADTQSDLRSDETIDLPLEAATCDPALCDSQCLTRGASGGVCREGRCICLGVPDGSADYIDTIDHTELTDSREVPSDTAAEEVVTCPEGKTLCGGKCVDTSSDGNNCGRCGHACGSDESCFSGYCCPNGCGVTDCSPDRCPAPCSRTCSSPEYCETDENAYLCCLTSCNNGSEACDDESFRVPAEDPDGLFSLVCVDGAGGEIFIATNSCLCNDGIRRCRCCSSRDQMNRYIIYSFNCNIAGERYSIDLSDYIGDILYAGTRTQTDGSGRGTRVCISMN